MRFVSLLPLRHWTLYIASVNVVAMVLVVLVRSLLPPVVPLFYGNPYGAEQLAPQGLLILPPLVALGVCGVNIAINLTLNDKFLEKVLFGSMCAATLLSTVTLLKIIFLVGNI